MIVDLLFGAAISFGLFVLAVYVGTILALRSFFGPDFVDPVTKTFSLEGTTVQIDPQPATEVEDPTERSGDR